MTRRDTARGFFPTEYSIPCRWEEECFATRFQAGVDCRWKKFCFEYHFLEIDQMRFKLAPEIMEGLDWCIRKQMRVKARTAMIFQAVKKIKQTVTGKKDSYHLKGKTRTHHLSWLEDLDEENADLIFASKVLANLYGMIAKADENTKELYRMVKEFKKSLKTHPAK